MELLMLRRQIQDIIYQDKLLNPQSIYMPDVYTSIIIKKIMPIVSKELFTHILPKDSFNQQITAIKSLEINKQQRLTSISGHRQIKINKRKLPLDWFPQNRICSKPTNQLSNAYQNTHHKDSISTRCDKLTFQKSTSQTRSIQQNKQAIKTSEFKFDEKINQISQYNCNVLASNEHQIPLQFQKLTEFLIKDQNKNKQSQNFELKINKGNKFLLTFADNQQFEKSLSCQNIKKQHQNQIIKNCMLPKLDLAIIKSNYHQVDKLFNFINLSSRGQKDKKKNKEDIYLTNKKDLQIDNKKDLYPDNKKKDLYPDNKKDLYPDNKKDLNLDNKENIINLNNLQMPKKKYLNFPPLNNKKKNNRQSQSKLSNKALF